MASATSTCSDNLITNLGPRADANSPQARNQTIAGRLFSLAIDTFSDMIHFYAKPAYPAARPHKAGCFLSTRGWLTPPTVPSYVSSIQGPVQRLSESPLSAGGWLTPSAEAKSRRAGLLSAFRLGMAYYARGGFTPYLRGIHPAYWQGCEHSLMMKKATGGDGLCVFSDSGSPSRLILYSHRLLDHDCQFSMAISLFGLPV
jgi:hypothetical protein